MFSAASSLGRPVVAANETKAGSPSSGSTARWSRSSTRHGSPATSNRYCEELIALRVLGGCVAHPEVGQLPRYCPLAVAQRLLTCLLRMLHDTLADCGSHRRESRRNCYRYHYITPSKKSLGGARATLFRLPYSFWPTGRSWIYTTASGRVYPAVCSKCQQRAFCGQVEPKRTSFPHKMSVWHPVSGTGCRS